MQSIKETTTYTHTRKKSRFVAVLKRVTDEHDALGVLRKTKSSYPDASHHCFAYVLGEHALIQKASDDGEPSKTAGKPILDVLTKNNLTDVILIVIRYYGGIKLGAGGLIRAYSQSARGAVDKAERIEKRTIMKATLTVTYPESADVGPYLNEHTTVVDERYVSDVTYTFMFFRDDLDAIKKAIGARTGYRSTPTIIAEEKRYI